MPMGRTYYIIIYIGHYSIAYVIFILTSSACEYTNNLIVVNTYY